MASLRTTDDSKVMTPAVAKRTTDGPVVVLERDLALDRFSVKHWSERPSNLVTETVDSRKRLHLVEEAGADEVETKQGLTPSKVNTARRGKSSDPGSSSGSRRVLVSEADVSTGCTPTGLTFAAIPSGAAEVEEELAIETLDPARLRDLANKKVAVIYEVCKKSGNLKGTSIKELKGAASILQEVIATALTRTVSEETLLLRRETRKLRQEVQELKADLDALRARAEAPPPTRVSQLQPEPPCREDHTLPQNMVDVMAEHMVRMERSLRVTMGEVITAQIDALEDRLLPAKVIRPPLAADRRNPPGPTKPKPSKSKTTGPNTAVPGPTPSAKDKTLAGRPLGMEWAELPASASAPPPTAMAPNEEGWTTVTRRHRRKKRTKGSAGTAVLDPASSGRAIGKKPKRKLPRTPRSAAIVITLQPEAQAGGLTYLEALTKARGRIKVDELGIESISLRPTAAGSRIIEIPGARGSEQADKLAQQLQELMGDVATVARPVKKVNVRVTGLDESVTVEEVVAAAAARGGCEPSLIKAGVIRPYAWGSGAVHLSLPVTAAKVLVEAKRLLVGWSAARVRLLESRPMRCFRCMDVGHKRPLCQSMIDRGTLCFRCGQPGHKALECVAEKLHCALCADASRPAGHHMGGAGCKPPQAKRRAPPAPTPS